MNYKPNKILILEEKTVWMTQATIIPTSLTNKYKLFCVWYFRAFEIEYMLGILSILWQKWEKRGKKNQNI